MKFVKLSTRHAEHVAKCQRSVRCWQCNFIRNRELLCKLFPIDVHAPELGSWIHETISPTSGDWEIGCKICELAGVECSSCDAKRHHLMRHHKSNRHRRAVCNLLGYEWESDKSSPCADNFKQLWRERRQGTSMVSACTTNDGVSHFRVSKQQQWCLAEAVRNRHRAFLRGCSRITIHQDSRKKRHTLRFRATAQKSKIPIQLRAPGLLQIRRGLLGHADLTKEGRGASGWSRQL